MAEGTTTVVTGSKQSRRRAARGGGNSSPTAVDTAVTAISGVAPNVRVSVAVSVAAPASASGTAAATTTTTTTTTMRALSGSGSGGAEGRGIVGAESDLQTDTAQLRAMYARFVQKWGIADAPRADAEKVIEDVGSVLSGAAASPVRHRGARSPDAALASPVSASSASSASASPAASPSASRSGNSSSSSGSGSGGWYRDWDVAMPMIAAVTFFISCLLTTGVFNSIANERRLLHKPLQRDDEPGTFAHRLPDVLFDVLPSVDNNWWPNALTYGFILWASFWVLSHSRRLTLTRRLLAPWGALLVMRCSTVTLTSLPDPNHMCYGSANPIQDQLMSFISGISCGDMIFSGHTVAMCCCALVLVDGYPYHTPLPPGTTRAGTGSGNGNSGLEECRPWHWLLHAVNTVWVTLGVLSLLVTRFHYTVDVVLAVYFALLVTCTYRLYVGDTARVQRSRFARWFERDEHVQCDACTCRCRALRPRHHSRCGSGDDAEETVVVANRSRGAGSDA